MADGAFGADAFCFAEFVDVSWGWVEEVGFVVFAVCVACPFGAVDAYAGVAFPFGDGWACGEGCWVPGGHGKWMITSVVIVGGGFVVVCVVMFWGWVGGYCCFCVPGGKPQTSRIGLLVDD